MQDLLALLLVLAGQAASPDFKGVHEGNSKGPEDHIKQEGKQD